MKRMHFHDHKLCFSKDTASWAPKIFLGAYWLPLMCLVVLLQKKQAPSEHRAVRLEAGEATEGFVGNDIKTAKYNLITFLPIFLCEVFSRAAYLYFLLQVKHAMSIISACSILTFAPGSTATADRAVLHLKRPSLADNHSSSAIGNGATTFHLFSSSACLEGRIYPCLW